MSTFVKLIKGALKSNTVQLNSVFTAIWAALLGTDWVQTNPELLAIMGGVQAIVNILLRFKTTKPLSER